MRSYGFFRKRMAGALLALSQLSLPSLTTAADDPVPPKPVEAPPLKPAYDMVSLRRQRVYCPPALPADCPAPLPPITAPDTSSTQNNNQPNNPQVNNPVPQMNTAPNLAANANATVPNMIGDALGAQVQYYTFFTNPYTDPNSGQQAFATFMYADGIQDSAHLYFRGVTPDALQTTTTIYQTTPGTQFGFVGTLPALTGMQAVNGSTVTGQLGQLTGLTPYPTPHPLGVVGFNVQPGVFTNIASGAGDTNSELPINGGSAFFDQTAALAVYNTQILPIVSPSSQRQKLADNASPIPRDRVYVNYNYFDGTPTILGKNGVNRVTPGFEKTFFNQLASIEVRFPFSTELSNSVNLDGVTNSSEAQFGNITVYLKGLLYSSPVFTVSSGLGVQTPTAGDTHIYSNGGEIYRMTNDSVHLLPFIAGTYTPGPRFYAQGILQCDFDTNGNRAYGAPYVLSGTDFGNVVPGALQKLGVVQDQSYLYASLGTGYWIYRDTDPNTRGLTGIAPTAELHYNTTMQKSDTVQDVYGNTIQPLSQVATLNGIVGVNTVFGNNKYFTVGYSAPFGRSDAQFNGELRVMFNYFFGGSTVNPRFNLITGR